MFLTLVTINLLRGPGNEPSIVGIQRCTRFDWILFGLLLIASALITYLGIFNLRKEFNYKKSIDFPFVQGDFKCTNKNAIMLASLGIGGGFHSRWFRDSANSVVSRGLSTEVTQQQCKTLLAGGPMAA